MTASCRSPAKASALSSCSPPANARPIIASTAAHGSDRAQRQDCVERDLTCPWEEGRQPKNSTIGGAAALGRCKGHKPEEYEGVAAFIDFLATAGTQLWWHKVTGYVPLTNKAYELAKARAITRRARRARSPFCSSTAARRRRTRSASISATSRRRCSRSARRSKPLFTGKKTPQQAMDDAVEARQRDPAPVREAERRQVLTLANGGGASAPAPIDAVRRTLWRGRWLAHEPGLKQRSFRGARVCRRCCCFRSSLILLFFFFIPSMRALAQSFLLADPFGNTRPFRLVRQLHAPCSTARAIGTRSGSRIWFTLGAERGDDRDRRRFSPSPPTA